MSWWRRQRASLIALVAAGALTLGAHVWLDVLPALETSSPVPTVQDGAVEVGGNELELDSVRRDEFEAPDGTSSLSVRLYARSAADAETCGSFTLTEVEGGRVWLTDRGALDAWTEDDETSCREGTDGYRILAVFLLPEDAGGPFWFDADVADEVVRFRIDL